MPPILATFLSFGFIAFLVRRDFREKPNTSWALWIPTLWFFILCSRGLSDWVYTLFGVNVGGSSLEEGSPVDATWYFGLIATGAYVLFRRGIRLSDLVSNNAMMAAFLGYCLLSLAWSDFPFVGFKRWIKFLGEPIMGLIVLTDPDPRDAFKRLMKRVAYIIVPISILFIKYYPQWGRSFSEWTGGAQNTGITRNKNLLGFDCLIWGYFFYWYLLTILRTPKGPFRRNELILCAAFLWMIGWLLWQAQSSTCQFGLVVGISFVTLLNVKWFRKEWVGTFLLVLGAIYVVGEAGFDLSNTVIRALGRDPTLTGRTDLWQEVLSVPVNRLVGTGFETFWLGKRLEYLWSLHWWKAAQSHNGYLDIYVSLGAVGLAFLGVWLISVFFRIRQQLFSDLEMASFKLGFFIIMLLYNWTEAAYKPLHPMWTVLCFVALRPIERESTLSEETEEPVLWEEPPISKGAHLYASSAFSQP